MTRRRTSLYWLCQIGGWFSWTAIGVLFTIAGPSSPFESSWWQDVLAFTAVPVASIAWTHGYRRYLRRRGWAGLGPGTLLPRVLGASIVLGAVIP